MSVWVSFGGKIMDTVNDAFINYSKYLLTTNKLAKRNLLLMKAAGLHFFDYINPIN